MSDPAQQREAVLIALERLLAWPEISRSPQLGRFLGYIVQRRLEGNEQSIKAYSIAVDVFGRAADFDPQADPIVRVQARRLRALLDDYYRGPGIGDPLQIHLPVGRYVPEFAAAPDTAVLQPEPEIRRQPAPGARTWSFGASWFTLAVIALGLAMAGYGIGTWRSSSGAAAEAGAVQRPTIAVVEFQNLANSPESSPMVAGLAIELVTDLEQFGNIGVRYGGSGESNAATASLPSDYVLTGIVRPDGAVVQYSAILTDSGTSAVVWNYTVAVPVTEARGPDVLDRVSKSLSLVLGSPRGPLHVAARQFLASGPTPDDQINPYLCRVLFDLYRETGATREVGRANACYAALPEADKATAAVLAATASLLAEQSGPAVDADGTVIDRLRAAGDSLQRAIGLEPISGFVWEQQARLHEAQGMFALSRADFSSSVQLNPASVDALAAYARLLALGGNLREAEHMARDAADGSPNPPPWYQGVPALLALRDGDFVQAITRAELYAEADRELGPILAIMAGQGAGDSAVVNRYLPQVLDVATFRAKGVLPRLRERISDDLLMDGIRLALVEAGVPAAALIGSF